MFENPRRGRQARNFTTNVLKILDLKSSSEQIFSENCRWVPLSLFYATKFSLFLLFAVHNFYSKLRSFTPVFSIRLTIVLSCFYLLKIFSFEKFSAWIWPLPFAVNTTLNLSIIGKLGRCSIWHISCLAPSYGMGSRLLFLYNELSLLWFFTSCEGFPLGFFAFHPSQKPAFPLFKSVRD